MQSHVGLPHMLGITPIGKFHDPDNEKMTLLDVQHPFWVDYHEPIGSPDDVADKIQTAIRSLKEDDIFRITYPYGEEAEIAYVEVDKMNRTDEQMTTECSECGSTIDVAPEIIRDDETYRFDVLVECPHCGFEKRYGTVLEVTND